ncbi:2-dehydropantoate 2-reductase [Bosea sp. LC85]|uniref:ketopantoate reductase family protein n=1 Tax=Bosea sp. LC85 TaxID=1502851 RepID=UPI0004E321EC|nr:2-dehydropantoate 2-reductase [Bosea sp. LC85]KFC66863.1 2-dehydropantoate 2-reductase [Bosea sp. LC85]
MRIAVMGSGGVGGYFGARLVKGGADVVFIARGAHLAAMRQHGLRIENDSEPIELPKIDVTDDASRIGRVDLILFAVKLWDTEAAARSLLPAIGPDTGLISFQNGVQKNDILRPIIGDAALIGGVGYVATAVSKPGVIAQIGTMQRLLFGEFDGRVSKRIEDFHQVCTAGDINAEISPDIRREIWQKFVFLVGLSGATTSMRMPLGQIRDNPLTRQFLLDLMKEALAVGRAHGIALPEDYAEQRLAFADGLPHDMIASMYHDLQAGKRLELPWLSGGVVDLGAAVGIPTPMNRAVRDILLLHAQGRDSR